MASLPWGDDAYISAITAWINNGAKDMFGQAPTLGNRQPQAIGFRAFPAGNTNAAYPREQGAGIRPIEVPAAQVDLWFAFEDDSTDASAFTCPDLSAWRPDRSPSTCQATWRSARRAWVPTSEVQRRSRIARCWISAHNRWARCCWCALHVNDGDHADTAELPNDGSSSDMTDLFTLKIVHEKRFDPGDGRCVPLLQEGVGDANHARDRDRVRKPHTSG